MRNSIVLASLAAVMLLTGVGRSGKARSLNAPLKFERAQDACFCVSGWRFIGTVFEVPPIDSPFEGEGCFETYSAWGCLDGGELRPDSCATVECSEFIVDYGCRCNGGGVPD